MAALTVLALAAGCDSGDQTPTRMEKPSRAPNEGMKGVRIQNFKVGDTRWVLTADSASVFREKKRVEALPVQIDFFEEDRHVSVLTADVGILLQATDDLEARGNVKVVTEEGTILTTEILFWDHHKSLIHTDEFVRIEKNGDVLTGVGMEADPGLDRIDIKHAVQGTVMDPGTLFEEEEE
ncbi:MAG TPA: LPS export ABC transporter periplasmic protein LptC [bacterium]|nr:LPS export ABC transporter periplasmic protein LptC [bacterium]